MNARNASIVSIMFPSRRCLQCFIQSFSKPSTAPLTSESIILCTLVCALGDMCLVWLHLGACEKYAFKNQYKFAQQRSIHVRACNVWPAFVFHAARLLRKRLPVFHISLEIRIRCIALTSIFDMGLHRIQVWFKNQKLKRLPHHLHRKLRKSLRKNLKVCFYAWRQLASSKSWSLYRATFRHHSWLHPLNMQTLPQN